MEVEVWVEVGMAVVAKAVARVEAEKAAAAMVVGRVVAPTVAWEGVQKGEVATDMVVQMGAASAVGATAEPVGEVAVAALLAGLVAVRAGVACMVALVQVAGKEESLAVLVVARVRCKGPIECSHTQPPGRKSRRRCESSPEDRVLLEPYSPCTARGHR